MAKEKRRPHRFEVEWVTISYRTIARWAGLLAALLALVLGGYILTRLEAGGERRDVERFVAAVEREVRAAGEGRGEGPSREVGEAQERLRAARDLLDGGDLPGARAAAEEARDAVRALSVRPADRAQVLRVEGRVEVKPLGQLEWREVTAGTQLGAGDLVKTGDAAAAQIMTLDASLVTLGPNSLIRIERSAKDRVSGKTDVAVMVNSGELTMATAEVQPPGSTSEVKTANASATVESNTVVGIGVEERGERSRIDVQRGRAKVRARDSVIALEENERLQVSPAGLVRRKLLGITQLISPPQYKLLLVKDLQGRPLELEWESIREARGYRVEVSQSPLFTRLVQRWDRHPSNYLTLGRISVGRYYWRVAAVDRDGEEGVLSPPGLFKVSDALPEGPPPPLKVSSVQPLGEGLFLCEGTTQPGVFLTIDDGEKVVRVQPGQSGQFRQLFSIQREGRQDLAFTARNSEGLETRLVQPVEVSFQ